MKNKMKNAEETYHWKVKVYKRGKLIDSWVIMHRTEQQALKEAEAETERISGANDWTMTRFEFNPIKNNPMRRTK